MKEKTTQLAFRTVGLPNGSTVSMARFEDGAFLLKFVTDVVDDFPPVKTEIKDGKHYSGIKLSGEAINAIGLLFIQELRQPILEQLRQQKSAGIGVILQSVIDHKLKEVAE